MKLKMSAICLKNRPAFHRESERLGLQGLRVSRWNWCDPSDTLPPDKFRWHKKLLRRQIRLLNATKREFREMSPQLFGKFTHCGQSRMQNIANCVVKTSNAHIVRDSYARFLQSLVDAGCGLVRADKERRRPLPASEQRLGGKIPQFAIFRMNFLKSRLKTSFLHGFLVSVRTSGKPGKPEIADVPNGGMTLCNEMSRNLRGTPHIVGINAVTLVGAPIANDVVSHNRKGDAPLAQRRENTHGMRAAQNHTSGSIRFSQGMRQPDIGRRGIEVEAKGDELKVPIVLGTIALGAEQDLGLKFIYRVAIPEHESDRPIFPVEGEVDAEFLRCGVHRALNFGVNLGISVGHTGNSRWADFGESGNVEKARFRGLHGCV